MPSRVPRRKGVHPPTPDIRQTCSPPVPSLSNAVPIIQVQMFFTSSQVGLNVATGTKEDLYKSNFTRSIAIATVDGKVLPHPASAALRFARSLSPLSSRARRADLKTAASENQRFQPSTMSSCCEYRKIYCNFELATGRVSKKVNEKAMFAAGRRQCLRSFRLHTRCALPTQQVILKGYPRPASSPSILDFLLCCWRDCLSSRISTSLPHLPCSIVKVSVVKERPAPGSDASQSETTLFCHSDRGYDHRSKKVIRGWLPETRQRPSQRVSPSGRDILCLGLAR